MKISVKHYVPGLIGNLLVTILGIVGIVVFITVDKFAIQDGFVYFTFLSNVLVIAVSLLNACLYIATIAKKKVYVKEGFQVLKLMSVVALAITFTMVVIFLAPATPDFGWFDNSQLFMHLVVPAAAVFSFIFLEYATKIRFRFFFMPIVFVILYGIFYVTYAFLAPAGTAVDWYGFMFEAGNRVTPVDPSKFTFANFFIFLGEAVAAALVFGFLLWLLNKIINLIFIGYVMEETSEEYSDEIEEPVEEAKEEAVEEKEEVTPTRATSSKKKTTSSKAKSAPANKKYKDGARVYHISRSKFVSRHWQVKLASGEKAIKIFPTQAEAIAYAKQLVKKQGGSIRIHSMKGQLRK